MNDQLQQTLNNVLVDLVSNAAKAKEFLASEIPDVVQQLLHWHFYKYLVHEVVGISLCVLAVVGCKVLWGVIDKDYRKRLKEYEDSVKNNKYQSKPEWLAPVSLVTLFLLIPGCVMMNIMWLQILIAPKVYLIEYAAKLASH